MTTDVIDRLETFHARSDPDLEHLVARVARRRRRRHATQAAAIAGTVGTLGVVVSFVVAGTPAVPVVGGPTTHEPPTSLEAPTSVTIPRRPVPGEVARITFLSVPENKLAAGIPVTVREHAWVEWLRLDPSGPGLGHPGVNVVHGHRTTYGAALYHLNLVDVDDRIALQLPDRRETYTVTAVRVLDADDDPASAVANRGEDSWIVIATHHPRFTDDQQLVVVARRLSRADAG